MSDTPPSNSWTYQHPYGYTPVTQGPGTGPYGYNTLTQTTGNATTQNWAASQPLGLDNSQVQNSMHQQSTPQYIPTANTASSNEAMNLNLNNNNYHAFPITQSQNNMQTSSCEPMQSGEAFTPHHQTPSSYAPQAQQMHTAASAQLNTSMPASNSDDNSKPLFSHQPPPRYTSPQAENTMPRHSATYQEMPATPFSAFSAEALNQNWNPRQPPPAMFDSNQASARYQGPTCSPGSAATTVKWSVSEPPPTFQTFHQRMPPPSYYLPNNSHYASGNGPPMWNFAVPPPQHTSAAGYVPMMPPVMGPWPYQFFPKLSTEQFQSAPPNVTLNVNQVIANKKENENAVTSEITKSAPHASLGESSKKVQSDPSYVMKPRSNNDEQESGSSAACKIETPPSSPEADSDPKAIGYRKFELISTSSSDGESQVQKMLAIEWKDKSDSSLSSDFEEPKKKKKLTKKKKETKKKEPKKKEPMKKDVNKRQNRRGKKDDDDDDAPGTSTSRKVQTNQEGMDDPQSSKIIKENTIEPEKVITLSSDSDSEQKLPVRPISHKGNNESSFIDSDTEENQCLYCGETLYPFMRRGMNQPCGCYRFCEGCATKWKNMKGDDAVCPKCFRIIIEVEIVQ